MRRILVVFLVMAPMLGSAADRGYIKEFYDARKIEKSDPKAAFEGMMRGFRLALEADNADYATSAGLCACFLLHQQEKTVETGKLAREVLDGIDPLPTDFLDNDILRRAQLFGFVETGLLMEGKVGSAWRTNRAIAELLRGKQVSVNADGTSITLKDVMRLQPEFQGLGWRLIEREAALLDVAGRTNEARVMLDDAAASMGDRWVRFPKIVRFYAFKILASRAMILDFLGYEEESIQAQRELEAAAANLEISAFSKLVLRLNLLRNLSQWEGPSEELLAQARETVDLMKKAGRSQGAERTLAKMELDFQDSQAAVEALRADAENNADLGHLFDAMYADRDLLMARMKVGEGGLDAEFTQLLNTARAQGNKRGEPSLYRAYGCYLLELKRPAEAIVMFSEALRLTRSFGWTLHEPGLLRPLFEARLAAGDVVGARATLAEMEAFIAKHPDIPAARRVQAEVGRAIAYASLDERDAARAALALARGFAVNLPAHKKQWLTPEAETAILAAAPVVVVSNEAPRLQVQPLGVVSLAVPGESARTRFLVFNPSNSRIGGQWEIQGPGAEKAGNAVRFHAGKPLEVVGIQQSVGAGDESALECSLVGSEGVESADVRISWENTGQTAGPAATWEVRWDSAAKNSAVLDASELENNPFRFTTLFHELAVPLGEEFGVPFRLRSPVPLRFEYYDARSQQLLAIDANGNGDFTEAGDLHVRGPAGLVAAVVPATATDRVLTVEVHIFRAGEGSFVPGDAPVLLEAEVHRGGTWTMEAQDVLKP